MCHVCRVVKTNGGSLPRNSADSVASLYFEGLLLMRSAIGSEFNARTMVRTLDRCMCVSMN